MLKQTNIKIILISIVLINTCNTANIVGVFAIPSTSHVLFASSLLKELAHRGHDVTMISGYPQKESIKNYRDVYLDKIFDLRDKYFFRIVYDDISYYKKVELIFEYGHLLAKSIFESESVTSFRNTTKHVDLFILLGLHHEVFLGLANEYKAPAVWFYPRFSDAISSYGNGNPTPYAYVPHSFTTYTDDMTFFERLHNSVSSFLSYAIQGYLNDHLQRSLLNIYFPSAPRLEDLMQNVHLNLINSHYSLEFIRPTLPGNIQIGGFHLFNKHEQALPDDLQKLMDSAPQGIIYLSFGTNADVSLLPKSAVESMIKIFSQLKHLVLWKTDAQLETGANVVLKQWFPQRAVLAHPHVKLFITHGGMGSVMESIYYSVPMIGIPFFIDQERNVANGVYGRYALRLKPDEINDSTFGYAVNEILTKPEYKENMKIRSSLLREQELNPMDRAVYWIEHVIKYNGTDHLKCRATSLPLYKYLLLDVVGFLLLASVLSSIIIYIVFKILKKLVYKTIQEFQRIVFDSKNKIKIQ